MYTPNLLLPGRLGRFLLVCLPRRLSRHFTSLKIDKTIILLFDRRVMQGTFVEGIDLLHTAHTVILIPGLTHLEGFSLHIHISLQLPGQRIPGL